MEGGFILFLGFFLKDQNQHHRGLLKGAGGIFFSSFSFLDTHYIEGGGGRRNIKGSANTEITIPSMVSKIKIL